MKIITFFVAVCISLLPLAAHSEKVKDFKRSNFYENENNAPNSYTYMADSTGAAPTSNIDSFKIYGNFCSDNKYKGDARFNDCKWQSVRSLLNEDVYSNSRPVQQKKSWYGWDIFLPSDFPLRGTQVKGGLIFTEFHNGQCPHIMFGGRTDEFDGLYFITNRALGNYECEQTKRIRVASMQEMRGKWTRFELYVEWDNVDGKALLFVDGNEVLDYSGRTLTLGHENLNYFAYGIYLCCTAGVDKVVDTNVYFSGIKRAATREGLEVTR